MVFSTIGILRVVVHSQSRDIAECVIRNWAADECRVLSGMVVFLDDFRFAETFRLIIGISEEMWFLIIVTPNKRK